MPDDHHKDDRNWINAQLSMLDKAMRAKICEQYSEAFRDAYKSEPLAHRKSGRARFKANTRLLTYIKNALQFLINKELKMEENKTPGDSWRTILGFGGTLKISKPHFSRVPALCNTNVITITFIPNNNNEWGISKEVPGNFVYSDQFGKDFSTEAKMMLGVI